MRLTKQDIKVIKYFNYLSNTLYFLAVLILIGLVGTFDYEDKFGVQIITASGILTNLLISAGLYLVARYLKNNVKRNLGTY